MTTNKLIFKPKKYKTYLLVIVSLVFIYGGTLMIKNGEGLKGWLATSFFALCLFVFIIQLFPGATQLELNEEGFTTTNLFKTNFTKWSDVNSFAVGSVGSTNYLWRKKMVMFDYAYEFDEYETGRNISKHLAGYEGALPDTYGMKANKLAELMNEWKRKYGS
ncbi:STM3941 family protein [Flavobacterium capsici]|uniref:STM3941 family protein n=1 Tax=Flavobacterium capsici TaxID=3075618 RepID=A0AA96J5Y9_9FLAO|nr:MULTISPECIES: STM3941 family protein [unclassified Flavobacterium]WNM18101.1 STM3941 family protein [Flavobacterium sp. PMR2A8]WNM22153.1 STM3941 family protein [Flavobacterium sp. PMTSA4]